MQIEQKIWTKQKGWKTLESSLEDKEKTQLVFTFGNRFALENQDNIDTLLQEYPHANIVLASTSGEILEEEVHDYSIVTSAIAFEETSIQSVSINIDDFDNNFEAGKILIEKLPQENLQHIFILSKGLGVNGTALLNGAEEILQGKISITGGLAGDEDKFEQTLVKLYQKGEEKEGDLIAVGFYGTKLKVGFGSWGGWDTFGPARMVTKSKGNVLYELDGKPALDLYKTYLGEKAEQLPASALLFPLSIISEGESTQNLVRTILSIDDNEKSMTFAGDIPEGGKVRLMKANFNRLVDGAATAAQQSKTFAPDFAVLVSCVGRKLVMGQQIEDEIEVVKEILGDNCAITGFYSYGELAPSKDGNRCHLHNQTMTITLLAE